MTAQPFLFGDEQVPPGTFRHLEVDSGRLPSGTETSMPIKVLHGALPGPTIWLSGALHGDEIVGVEIIRSLLEVIDVERLSGTILAVPIVNVFGFVSGSRYLPDRRDLNRSFPGSKTGSLAARLARLFIDTVVERCEFGIDYHAGSDDRTNLPQIRGNMDDEETLRLARAFGAEVIVHGTTIQGSLRETALDRGKRILLFEGGEPRRFSSEAADAGVIGTLRVLGALGMIDDPPPPRATPPLESSKTTWVRAPRGGIFRPEIELGQMLTEGQRVGLITDPTDPEYHSVDAPMAGIVLGMGVNPLVHAGEGLVHIAAQDAKPRST